MNISKFKLKGVVAGNSFFVTLALVLFLADSHVWGQQTPLDKSLGNGLEDVESNIFKDMGVVQRRAMPKSGRFLLSNYGALDFSDGPYTIYSVNINPGIAVSDFFEIYINAVPFFVHKPRSIVEKVQQFRDSNGDQLTIGSVKPKYQYGLELLWAPLYGKDSLGSSSIVRSDTFLKFGASQIIFEDNDKGMKYHVGVGKTFFATKWMGLRVAVDGSYQSSIAVAGSGTNLVKTKSSSIFAFFEAGLIFYL